MGVIFNVGLEQTAKWDIYGKQALEAGGLRMGILNGVIKGRGQVGGCYYK